jgi:hypothetical protein
MQEVHYMHAIILSTKNGIRMVPTPRHLPSS